MFIIIIIIIKISANLNHWNNTIMMYAYLVGWLVGCLFVYVYIICHNKNCVRHLLNCYDVKMQNILEKNAYFKICIFKQNIILIYIAKKIK